VDMLRVRSGHIVDTAGRPVRLRGVCLGGWLNQENFITGYPGAESAWRDALASALGPERAEGFFKNFLDCFITDADLAYLASLGASVVRIPFNYRHFEDDKHPGSFKDTGFTRLDHTLELCRRRGLYAILDLHAAPGWQNPDWHSDNTGTDALLWEHPGFRQRTVALWAALAERYRSRACVAGYNLLNEPVAPDPEALNQFYREVTAAIRSVDSEHLLFLEGNHFSVDFSQLEAPFDENTVYSLHYYVTPGFATMSYPGEHLGKRYDLDSMAEDYAERRAFMTRHQVPCWVGEYGVVFKNERSPEDRLRCLSDLLAIFERFGDHHTYWTYKDIGVMGLVTVAPESPWMVATRQGRDHKRLLSTDCFAMDRGDVRIQVDHLLETVGSLVGRDCLDLDRLRSRLYRAVFGVVLSEALLPSYAAAFKGLDQITLEGLADSFRFERCVPRREVAKLLAKTFRLPA